MQVHLCHSTLVSADDLTSRVCDYIKYGWDVLLTDPDDGVNVKRKLQTTAKHRILLTMLCFNLYHLLKMLIGPRLCIKHLRLHLELSTNF